MVEEGRGRGGEGRGGEGRGRGMCSPKKNLRITPVRICIKLRSILSEI
jgi:hypothetical protein